MIGVRKIVSGGQAGADRAALDFALENRIETGGYVPLGRTAEDGPIPDKYRGLTEANSPDPAVRTELNVIHSDATLIVTDGDPAGGTALTAELAGRHRKPRLHIDLSRVNLSDAARQIIAWLRRHRIGVLNIAGPRASEDPGIYSKTLALLEAVKKESGAGKAPP